jgi:hypothetical protein
MSNQKKRWQKPNGGQVQRQNKTNKIRKHQKVLASFRLSG